MRIGIGIGVGCGQGGGGGGPAPFVYDLLNEAGSSTITSVPNLRISVDAGATWHAVGSVPGHTLTVARGGDGQSLVISGWAGGVIPAGTLFHYEQQIPGEPSSAGTSTAANLPALYFKRVGGPAPVNTTLPGMTVAATRLSAPVGVT